MKACVQGQPPSWPLWLDITGMWTGKILPSEPPKFIPASLPALRLAVT